MASKDIGGNMQPHYGDLSKTSRTVADEDHFMSNKSPSPTKQAINAVIRRPHKVHKRNKTRKIAYFQRKHKLGQRVSYIFPNPFQRIIQKPWSRPMAAQHLAAIKIQGAIRKFLYIKRKKTGMLIPYFQQKRLQEQRKQL